MKSFYRIITGFIGLTVTACSSDPDFRSDVPVVPLSMKMTVLPDTQAAKIFTDPSYIKLQGVMLGEIQRILAWGDRYVIFDRKQNNVYLFDTTGMLIRQVGRKGKGPQEYIQVSGVAIQRDSLLLYADSPNKLMYYNRNGDFLKEQFIGSRYCFLNGIASAGDKLYGAQPANRGTSGHTVSLISGDATTDYLLFSDWPAAVSGGSYMNAADSGVIWISRPFDNTVYRIGSESDEPQAVLRLDFGAGNMPEGYADGIDDYDLIMKAHKEGVVLHAARPCQIGNRLLIGTIGGYYLIDLQDLSAQRLESISVGDGIQGQLWSYIPIEYQSQKIALQLIPERIEALGKEGKMPMTPALDSLLAANAEYQNPILVVYRVAD